MPITGNISAEYVAQRRVEIGEQLKAIREAAGLNISSLAEQSNIAKSTIEKLEAGRWNCPIETLIVYCSFLDVKITFHATSAKR